MIATGMVFQVGAIITSKTKWLTANCRRGTRQLNLISYTMKKFLFILFGIIMLGILAPTNSEAKPFWLKFKLGLFAKWSISFTGNCQDGWGICLAFGDNLSTDTYLGYDDATNKFSIKVSKTFSQAKEFSRGIYEIKENSPVDPRLISNLMNFNSKGKKVIIKKGIYKIYDEGDYYVFTVDYLLE
jgi:hypothetical protein